MCWIAGTSFSVGTLMQSKYLKIGKIDVKIFKCVYGVKNAIEFLDNVALVCILIIADSDFSSSKI